MNNYTNLLIETIKLEIKKNEFLISFTKKKLNSNKEEIEIYKNNIDKINIKINDLKNGDFVSHNVLPNDHTNTLLNTYIHRELNWFGSSSYNHIEEATKSISKQYNISLYDSLRILNISDKLLSLETKLTTDPIIKKILEEKNSEKSKNYKNSQELKDEIKKEEEKILFILNKKYISTEEFSKLYIKRLELDRGISKDFDEFLDWLVDSIEYGVISSFCESDEYYKYRDDFENENINPKDFI